MQPIKRVLVLGATGAVGRDLVSALEQHAHIEEIITLTRRPCPATHTKVRNIVVDFRVLNDQAEYFRCDAVLCALGSTRKQAGSDQQYMQIDHDYPLTIARITQKQGARHFLLVSALGANLQSPFFYNRLKGQTENDLMALGFAQLTIVRPSILIRHSAEKRPLEQLTQRLARYAPLKWRAVSTQRVAQIMVNALTAPSSAVRIIENPEICTGLTAT